MLQTSSGCEAGGYTGTLLLGAPASLEERNLGFYDNSLKLRRNCDLFSRLVTRRGGIAVGAERYAVQCVYVGDDASSLQVANATARVVIDRGADFLLGPYGSGLMMFASKQAVLERRIMISSSGSSPAIYAEARALAREAEAVGLGAGTDQLVFGLLPGSKTYARRAFEAVVAAAEECDASTECDRSRCDVGRSCVDSLRVGLVIEDDVFPRAVCDDATPVWRGAQGSGNATLVHLPKYQDVDQADYDANMANALAALREARVNVVMICSYVNGGIAAVEAMERLRFAPLIGILTVSLSESAYVQKLGLEGWWQGEYFIEPQGWNEQLPGAPGEYSNWTSAQYAAEFAAAFDEEGAIADNNFVGAATFAGLCALADAIERAGTLETAAVAAALNASRLVEFYAPIRFDANGQLEKVEFPVVQYAPGAWRCRGCAEGVSPRVVDFPASLYNGRISRLIFPMPTWEWRACAVERGNCSGRGECTTSGICACEPFFFGDSCELDCVGEELFKWNGTTCVPPAASGNANLVLVLVLVGSFSVVALLFAAALGVLLRRRYHLSASIAEMEREFARWEVAAKSGSGRYRAHAALHSLPSSIRMTRNALRRGLGGSKPGSSDESANGSRARVVAAPGLPYGMFHTFISHVWSSGQDQSRSLKGLLQKYIQNIVCFLDVDNLEDIGRLDEYIENTGAIIIFLTGSVDESGECISDYMRSTSCMIELRAAVRLLKPLILVLETDASHGGVPLAVHEAECPADIKNYVLSSPIIPWHRLKDFQICSMRMLVEQLLKAWQAPGADRPIFIPAELLRTPIPPLACEKSHHLFVSSNNPGASGVAGRLQTAAAGRLRMTSDAQKRSPNHCLYFLVYLNRDTFSSETAAALHTELLHALFAEMALLLVHEQRLEYGGIPFDEVIRCTPTDLKKAGIYRRIATPLYPGPHAAISLRLLVNQINISPPSLWRHPTFNGSRSWSKALQSRRRLKAKFRRAVEHHRRTNEEAAGDCFHEVTFTMNPAERLSKSPSRHIDIGVDPEEGSEVIPYRAQRMIPAAPEMDTSLQPTRQGEAMVRRPTVAIEIP